MVVRERSRDGVKEGKNCMKIGVHRVIANINSEMYVFGVALYSTILNWQF